MIILNFLLLIIFFIAYLASISKTNFLSRICLILIILLLSLFAGLRIAYNDTEAYMYSYQFVSSGLENVLLVDYKLSTYPGFNIFQIIIKTIFGNNPQTLIFLCSFIYIFSFLSFYYKYSSSFVLSVYLFITAGFFVFSMAAIKQALSISIVFAGLDFLVKRKFFLFILILLLASTFHPYILMLSILISLLDRVWSKKIVLIILLFVLLIVFFEPIIRNFIKVIDLFGFSYKEEDFLLSKSINLFRVLVYSVTPLLTFLYRNKINKAHDLLLNFSVNASLISFLILIPGLFSGANMFYRLSQYFLPFSLIAFIWILDNAIEIKFKYQIKTFSSILYYIFFMTSANDLLDKFRHLYLKF